ncbi:Hypothetical predicted protein [Octopus vulgaris]|uniref:Uncharacterized protein n=2 Tax=Octopus TaxID=6643 RepID=A0AA36B594_OCTVU|nr:uncharacterized protein LOC115216257 [Octopus sinensis]XP_036362715.1 uncharacterized protein LOC115216257 [Octopus sinensis]CAI9727618.1 Hypothetical predicted protein [Octopus vulgaris]
MTSNRCCEKFGTIVAVIKAVVSRSLFTTHGLICIWRLTVVKKNLLYWCMGGSILLIVLETIFTLKKKRGGEWKWFCPSVFLYLAYSLPPIWLLELDLLKRRMDHRVSGGTRTPSEVQNLSLLASNFKIMLDPEKWVRILQQVLLLLLIIGRWLLPKGKISREQLSQLLLVYIGMAADIIELFEAFKEEVVKYNWTLTIVILSLWTASLLQFTFVVTTSKARRPRPLYVKEKVENLEETNSNKTNKGLCCCCCTADIISILTTIILQDGPFLVLRMLLIFRYNVLSYTNIFFTSKNTLVILLQFYRLVVLYCEKSSICKNTAKNDTTTENSKVNSSNSTSQKAINRKPINTKSSNKKKNGASIENKVKKMKSLDKDDNNKTEKQKHIKNESSAVKNSTSEGNNKKQTVPSSKNLEESGTTESQISEEPVTPLHSVSRFLLSGYNRSLHDNDSVKEDLPQVLELTKTFDNLPGPVLWSSDEDESIRSKSPQRNLKMQSKSHHPVKGSFSSQDPSNMIKRIKDSSGDNSPRWSASLKQEEQEPMDSKTVEQSQGVIQKRKLIFPKLNKKTRK